MNDDEGIRFSYFDINKESPASVAEMICKFCGHKWVAVYPTEAKTLQCSKCKHYTEVPTEK